MDRRVSVLVLSVPHTGTYFVLDSVLRNFKRRQANQPLIPGCKIARHIAEPDRELTESIRRQCVTVVPIREYAAVKKTWQRNGMNVDQLAEQWGEMQSLENVFRLQIDAPDRDSQLEKLSNLIGEPLHTDWKPINSMNFSSIAQ